MQMLYTSFFVYRNTKSNVQTQCDDVPKNTIADSEATITAIPQMNRDKLKYLNIFMLVGTLSFVPVNSEPINL